MPAGYAQHIVQRGNNREACFFEEANYLAYLHRLGIGAEQLPPHRLAEVENSFDFLRTREERAAAGVRLGESLAKLDALNLPPLSDEEIAAEIAAAREERAARIRLGHLASHARVFGIACRADR